MWFTWFTWFTSRSWLPAARPAVRRAAAGAVLLLLSGCAPTEEGVHAGYVEGEFVYVAAPLAGHLTRLEVVRGAEVAGGQALFALESEVETAAVQEAESRLAEADHRLADLRKGRRPSELAVLEARVQEMAARLALAEIELRRKEQLRDDQVIAPAELDVAVARRTRMPPCWRRCGRS
ncbi:MAG: biotin/lipoyl-binding protein [Verrucomicrobiales bacterium]|nr:biotin/lipoyl-binding protein [Verrucomicrobiales bacterium]